MERFCECSCEREISGSLSGVAADSILLGCDAVSLEEQVPTFRKIVLPAWYKTPKGGIMSSTKKDLNRA